MLAKGAETLPGKVAHDYKALAKLYDARQHRKGLKNAEKILEKHPEHPETNAMKALFQLGLGEEDKAEVTAKMALMKSKMSSMFCWHTYGTVMKQKKNFQQAAKCFQQAVNFQKDNMQLLRQTASLQIQVRDHNNHVATRLKILQLKPNLIHNWVGFAVAHHLKGDFEQLYKALASIENLRHSAEMKPIEISHYFIYRVIALIDGEKIEEAFEELNKNKDKIVDEDVWNELMLKCCNRLNKRQRALESLEFLITKYPQNIEYMKDYQQIANLTPREVYKKIGTQFKSKIARIYQISHLADESEFKTEFIQFIKPYYQKNLISLFAEIQVLYETTKFENAIEEVFLALEGSLKENKYIDGTEASSPGEYLWSLYLLAQHYSRKFQTLNKAYDYINRAIEHTMTVTEFYVIKAEIEYKLHRNVDAIKTINEARKTDLADRYMNNICIKFILKCQKPSLAEDILKLFMRDQASMYELQNQWFIIEVGKAFLRMKNYPAGLRHLNFIQKQFQDISSNQIDFHTYCIRKWTLKEYIEYISFNDNIYKDKKYVEAASYAIDNLFEYARQLEIQASKPVEAQKEYQQAKKKKKKNKAKVPEVEQLTPDEALRKKLDYFGKDYETRIKANPLDEALIYSKNVTSAQYTNKSNRKQNKLYARAFASSIKTFINFNKPLLVIKALKKLLKTESDPFLELITTVKSIIFLQSALTNEKTNEVSKQFIKDYLVEILGESKDAKQYVATVSKKLPAVFNRQMKNREIELVLNGKDTRDGTIQYLRDELQSILKSQNKDVNTLQQVFYLVHRLEFYGQFTKQFKDQLNTLYGDQTTYFTEWSQAIDKLPQSTWGIFWLSDYDIQREEQDEKKQESKEVKEETKTVA